MNFNQSLHSVIEFLNQSKIPYMVIGGFAVSLQAEPRQTFDIDIKIQLDNQHMESDLISGLQKVGKILVTHPHKFLNETMVLPVEIKGVRMDLILAVLPYELEAIKHASEIIIDKTTIKVSTPEDLIIQKCISERIKDWQDIENIIISRKKELKWSYIIKNINQLSVTLEKPEIINRIMKLKDEK